MIRGKQGQDFESGIIAEFMARPRPLAVVAGTPRRPGRPELNFVVRQRQWCRFVTMAQPSEYSEYHGLP